MELAMFILLGLVAVAAGIGVIVQRSAVRSALFLLVNFASLAGLYVLLNAQFIAAVQVIIYAGAIVVLFLFVVMLLGIEHAEETPELTRRWIQRLQWIAGGLLGLVLLAGIIWAVVPGLTAPGKAVVAGIPADNAQQIGAALSTGYVIPFELASLVLLIAIIGAVVLAKKRREG